MTEKQSTAKARNRDPKQLSFSSEPTSKTSDSPAMAVYFRFICLRSKIYIQLLFNCSSLRALYGTDTVMNAVHGCDSGESAAR